MLKTRFWTKRHAVTELRQSRKRCQLTRKRERKFLETVISNCKGRISLLLRFTFSKLFILFISLLFYQYFTFNSFFCSLLWEKNLDDYDDLKVIMYHYLWRTAKNFAKKVKWAWQSAKNCANRQLHPVYISTVIPTGDWHGVTQVQSYASHPTCVIKWKLAKKITFKI